MTRRLAVTARPGDPPDRAALLLLPGAAMARRLSRANLPLLLILPSLVMAVAVIIYPFFVILRLSFANVSPFGQLRGFVGWANYANVLADPIFYGSLLRTLVWTAAVVGGTVLISMPVALVLQQDFYGRSDRPHDRHAALGAVAGDGRDPVAVVVQRRLRHDQRDAARASG